MLDAVRIALAMIVAYFVGSVPWALVVGKRFYGVDLRTQGSGNLGATNVYRVLGWKAGLAVALLDIAKGSLAVGIAWLLSPYAAGTHANDWVAICASLGAMLGHSYSPWAKMRGGKGVATAAGGLLLITPLAVLPLLMVFALIIALGRIVSLASIAVAIAYPPLCLFLYPGRTPIAWMSFAAAALVIWRHRSNIARMARREEPRVSFSKKTSPTVHQGSDTSASVAGTTPMGEDEV